MQHFCTAFGEACFSVAIAVGLVSIASVMSGWPDANGIDNLILSVFLMFTGSLLVDADTVFNLDGFYE